VQALAEPGTVLVTARVQRQVAGLFVAEERGTHTLKGVPEPTALFKLVRASGGGRRSAQRNLTPLVGRDDEMAMLLRRWERARQGDGQLVMIVGEPGLGKSRLIEEFHARLADTPHTWVEWSCSQLLQNTPLHPIAEWGRQRFGGADVPAERRLADLESSLAQVKLDPAENASLLAPLLDIPLPQGRTAALAPEELRRRQLAALTNWVMAGARVQPVVLAFEDLHWADPTTLDVLRGIAERGALAPLFVVATTRPEFRPPWGMRSHHGTISLAPLDRAQVQEMVAELSARHALPREVVEDVAARTGGVPLFVEEVTRLLLERGAQGGIETIPPTLQQSLMARLDRLGPAREVAQIGSVIGRGFSYSLLRDVAGIEDAALQAALEKLAEADIVLVQGLPPESDYRFKHALVQDAAYENLLKSRRQVLHRRVAESLRDRFAAIAAAEPESLAHHFTQAGLTDAAIEWWGKAGEGAQPDTPVRRLSRMRMQTSYGYAMLHGRGHASPETRVAFARACELATGVEDAAERFSAYYGLWAGSFVRAELGSMREAGEALLREAQLWPGSLEAAVAHRIVGTTLWFQGDYAGARVQLEQALAAYDNERDRELAPRFGFDVRVQAEVVLALVLWVLGLIDQSGIVIQGGLSLAARARHNPSMAFAHFYAGILAATRGDPAQATPHANALFGLAREHGMPLWLAHATFLLGWVNCRASNPAGETGMRQGLRLLREQNIRHFEPLFGMLLAEIEASAGDLEAGLATMDAQFAIVAETGEHWFFAEMHRIRGEILLKRDPANPAPAEEAFFTAIAVAQQQKARSFELRAALSLAKLYQSTSRAADAHAVLASALEGFAATLELPEIEEAQTLLNVLAQSDEIKTATAHRQRRFRLQSAYSNALLHGRGMSPPETTAAFAKTRELAASIENPAERFSAYYGLWVGPFIRGNLAQMREVAEAFMRDVERWPTSPEAGIAHRLLGTTCWYAGDYAGAQLHLDQALAVYDHERDLHLSSTFAYDQGVLAKFYLGITQYALGGIDRGVRLVEDSLRLALQGGHIPTVALARHYMIVFAAVRRDLDRATPHAQALLDLGLMHGLPSWLGFAKFSLAWAGRRDNPQALAEMRAALSLQRDMDFRVEQPLFGTLLAEAEAAADHLNAGLSTVDEQLAAIEQTGERWFEAEVHRVRGEIQLKYDPASIAPAEDAFLKAIAVAREQKARSFELRAAMSMARLWRDQGKPQQARELLAPVYGWFTEGFDTLDLKEAKALLDALAQSPK